MLWTQLQLEIALDRVWVVADSAVEIKLGEKEETEAAIALQLATLLAEEDVLLNGPSGTTPPIRPTPAKHPKTD